MKTRVTQSDIAYAAGVHNTTVSLALRNCPALPQETRLRIQSIAKSMGYCPDPMLRALVSYRNGQAQRRRQQAIAYITGWETKWGWRDVPEELEYCLGAERKASESGYRLEHFSLTEPGMTEKRLGDMLYHRGIRGALVASQSPGQEALSELDWSRLSAIQIGAFPRTPGLCRVMSDDYGALRIAVRKALQAGYERIGFVLPQRLDDLADQAWSSAFLVEQHRVKAARLLPIFQRESWSASPTTEETEFGAGASVATLERWMSLHRPDVIIGWSSQCLRDLNLLGVSSPRDVAFIDLSLDGSSDLLAGIHRDREKAGEIAVDLLLGQMERNICGIPQTSTTTLVESTWREGMSLPQKKSLSVTETRRAVARETVRSLALASVPQAV